MHFIGIDPGNTGGWAFVTDEGYAEAHTFSSYTQFRTELPTGKYFIVLEKVHSSPQMGVSSAFTFGSNFGGWEGTLQALLMPYELISPNTWQRNILGTFRCGESKIVALEFATRRWPELKLKKSHSGKVDALCMALYAQRLYTGDPKAQKEPVLI